jgi:hypothetical protein
MSEKEIIETIQQIIDLRLESLKSQRKELEDNEDMQRTFLDGGIAVLIRLNQLLGEIQWI